MMHTIVQLTLQLDGHDTVVVLVVQGEGALAVGLVSNIIWVINDLPEIYGVQSF